MTAMNLRKVGGSVAVVIPPIMLEKLNLQVGSSVDLSINNNILQVKPIKTKPRYNLTELLAQSDFENIENDNTWLNSAPVGQELL